MYQIIPLRDLRGLCFSAMYLEFDYVGIIVGKDLQFNADTKKYFTVWDNYKDAKGKQGLLKNPEELNKLVRQIYFVRRSLGVGVPDIADEGDEGVLCLFYG